MNPVFFRQQLTSYFTGQISQGRLWWLWMAVLPVVPLIAYMLLGYVRILPETEGVPRTVYIVIGMTFWLMFYDSVSAPFRSIERNKQYFLRKEISLATLLASWMPERLFASLIQLIFCAVFTAIHVETSPLNLVGFILIYAVGTLFFLNFGYLLAVVGLISPSTLNLSDVTNRFMLFISGVIFPMPDSGITGIIQYANPYYVFIENGRSILIGRGFDWLPMAAWLSVGALIGMFLFIQLPKIDSDVRDFLQ